MGRHKISNRIPGALFDDPRSPVHEFFALGVVLNDAFALLSHQPTKPDEILFILDDRAKLTAIQVWIHECSDLVREFRSGFVRRTATRCLQNSLVDQYRWCNVIRYLMVVDDRKLLSK